MVKSAYIHIPFCKNICSYCDFCKFFYKKEWINDYLESLKQEINDNYKGEVLNTIYIGGGTPSSLSIDELKKLFSIIDIFKLNDIYEYTIEFNIEDINKEKLQLCKDNNVNRISIGVESFNKDNLEFLGRNIDVDIEEKINLAKKYFDNINIDLMYAIPSETIDELENDIDTFLSLDIPHISTYSLIIEKNTVMYNNKLKNIDEDTDYEMYKLIIDKLKSKYNHYEISNFSKFGLESRHNLTYWNNNNYYGFGVGASGYINNTRYDNTRSITKYIAGNYRLESNKLSYNEEVENAFILGFRKLDGINIKEFSDRYKFNPLNLNIVKKLVKENKLVIDEYNIKISDDYIYLSNDILCNFLGINYQIEKNINK